MTEIQKALPDKLKNDAIIEVHFEIRFSMQGIPEVFFGRIAECAAWKNFKPSQLPVYQIPAAMRYADPNLRYQPLFALIDEDEKRALRIGPQIIVYSRNMPYVGWQLFKKEINEVISALFEKAGDSLSIERLGLRYLNALRSDFHGIRSIADLDMKIAIKGEQIKGSVNVNITTGGTSDTACTVRVATPDVILGTLPPETSVYVDVDVFTDQKDFFTSDRTFVEKWIERSHDVEKKNFFRLLKQKTIESLKEE